MRVLLVSLFVIRMFIAPGWIAAEEITVWIGMATPRHGETEGIYRATLDTEAGKLSEPELAAEIPGAGFLALDPDGKKLYSLCQTPNGEGGVAAFEIDGERRTLRLLNMQPTGDGESCHLALDKTARCLFSAQYGTGSICAYRLGEEGTIQPRSAHIRHSGSGPNRQRQEGPHPHWVGMDFKNRFLFVPDLGIDQVVIYRVDLDRGQLEPHGRGKCPAGAGPRHFKFHPNGKFAYVINELQLSVTAFRYDAEAGTLEAMQTIPTLPEDERRPPNSGSEIRIHPSGQFLYAANRGNDSITAFAINPQDGQLKLIEREPARGRHPRNFNIDPTGRWLLVAGRDSDSITVFKIDVQTGALEYTGTSVPSPAPICIAL
jgi:6-phosphogluconolactonase